MSWRPGIRALTLWVPDQLQPVITSELPTGETIATRAIAGAVEMTCAHRLPRSISPPNDVPSVDCNETVLTGCLCDLVGSDLHKIVITTSAASVILNQACERCLSLSLSAGEAKIEFRRDVTATGATSKKGLHHGPPTSDA